MISTNRSTAMARKTRGSPNQSYDTGLTSFCQHRAQHEPWSHDMLSVPQATASWASGKSSISRGRRANPKHIGSHGRRANPETHRVARSPRIRKHHRVARSPRIRDHRQIARSPRESGKTIGREVTGYPQRLAATIQGHLEGPTGFCVSSLIR